MKFGKFHVTFLFGRMRVLRVFKAISLSPALGWICNKMPDMEAVAEKSPKKSQKHEKKHKKKRKDETEVEGAGEDEPDRQNKKKRKREEVVLTEEEIAAAKAERSRKRWKKHDAKVRLRKSRILGLSENI